MRDVALIILAEIAIAAGGITMTLIHGVPFWIWPTTTIACLVALPVVAYGHRIAEVWRHWINRRRGRGTTNDDERNEVLRLMRLLQKQLETWSPTNPRWHENASRSVVLGEKLTKMGLCPASTHPEAIDVRQWQIYLNFILPYVEEFGVERAREETQKRGLLPSGGLTNEPAGREPGKRVYTQRTAPEIFAAIQNMTDVEVERFAEPHIGKWLRVQSVVRNISQTDGFYYVMLGKWFDPMPYLAFAKDKWSSIGTMTQGHRLAAEGQIFKIEHRTLYLDCCEILDLQEEDDVLRQPKPPIPGTPAA